MSINAARRGCNWPRSVQKGGWTRLVLRIRPRSWPAAECSAHTSRWTSGRHTVPTSTTNWPDRARTLPSPARPTTDPCINQSRLSH